MEVAVGAVGRRGCEQRWKGDEATAYVEVEYGQKHTVCCRGQRNREMKVSMCGYVAVQCKSRQMMLR